MSGGFLGIGIDVWLALMALVCLNGAAVVAGRLAWRAIERRDARRTARELHEADPRHFPPPG